MEPTVFFVIPMSSRGDFVAHPYLHHCAPLPSKPMGGDFSPTTTLSALQTSTSGPHSPPPPSPNEWEYLHCPSSIHQLTVRGLCHTHPSALQMSTRGLAASITPPLPSLEQLWARMGFCHPTPCMYHYISPLNEQEPSFCSFLLLAICIINLNIITMSFSFPYLSNAFGSGSKRKKEKCAYMITTTMIYIFMLCRVVLVFAV